MIKTKKKNNRKKGQQVLLAKKTPNQAHEVGNSVNCPMELEICRSKNFASEAEFSTSTASFVEFYQEKQSRSFSTASCWSRISFGRRVCIE